MRKPVILSLIFCFIFISLWVSPVKGENYISKSVPSDEMIAKLAGGQVLGYITADGVYEFYILKKDKTVDKFILYKLNTNIWMVQTLWGVSILQR